MQKIIITIMLFGIVSFGASAQNTAGKTDRSGSTVITWSIGGPLMTTTTVTPDASSSHRPTTSNDDHELNDPQSELNTKNALLVYPNPVSSILNLNMEKINESFTYRIIDPSGKIIDKGFIKDFGYAPQLDVTNLSNGIYQLIILTDFGPMQTRFIKQ